MLKRGRAKNKRNYAKEISAINAGQPAALEPLVVYRGHAQHPKFLKLSTAIGLALLAIPVEPSVAGTQTISGPDNTLDVSTLGGTLINTTGVLSYGQGWVAAITIDGTGAYVDSFGVLHTAKLLIPSPSRAFSAGFGATISAQNGAAYPNSAAI